MSQVHEFIIFYFRFNMSSHLARLCALDNYCLLYLFFISLGTVSSTIVIRFIMLIKIPQTGLNQTSYMMKTQSTNSLSL